ncbi:MAG: hypothetical protein JRI68_07795 [Deltaproteobacteria bacterium]|nr:hypothetical protein [Deltaproteobacteria bacterium]
MAAQAQTLPLRRRLGDWLALLPVRVDDRRLWLCLGLGVLLRAVVLEGTWMPLRTAMAWCVAQSLSMVGMAAELVAGPAIALGPHTTIGLTVRCSHIEVFALVLPLLWDRSATASRNLLHIGAVGAALFAMGVARIDLSIALYLQGVAWEWAHDGLLGVCYFAVLAPILSRGAWRGTAEVPRPTSAS